MTPQELTQLIMNYVDEAIANKISENRFNPVKLSATFAEWERIYMGKYDGNEVVTHSTLRQLMNQLDVVYDYNLVQSSNDALDRVIWITPNLAAQNNPTSGSRALISAVTNLVITGAGAKPILNVNPLDASFTLAGNISIGGIAYNSTDDKWYYSRANGVIADFKTGTLLPEEVSGLPEHLASYGILSSAVSDHIALTNAHLEPDGTTIKVTTGKLEAQLHTFANYFDVVGRAVSLKYNTDDFNIVDGVFTFKRSIPDITSLSQTVVSNTQSIVTINEALISLDLRVTELESGEVIPGGGTTGEVITITDSTGTPKWYIKAVGNSLGFYNASNVLVASLSSTGAVSAKDEVSAYSNI